MRPRAEGLRRLRVEIDRVVVEGFADAGSGDALRAGLERELASRLAAPGVDVSRGGSRAEIQRVEDPATGRLTERAADAVVRALRGA